MRETYMAGGTKIRYFDSKNTYFTLFTNGLFLRENS
jgi:hypothetical protein